jgi:hypothetical protein
MELSFLKFTDLSKIFSKNKIKSEVEEQETIEKNSQGISAEEYNSFINASKISSMPQVDNYLMTAIDFTQIFESKQNRVAKYREMSLYPEIGDAISYVVGDSIVEDDEGNILQLEIDTESQKVKMPKNTETRIRKIWEDTINHVYKVRENAESLFKRWLIDCEIYLEQVLNDEKNDIIAVKILPSFTMVPIYKGSKIIAFRQTISKAKMGAFLEKSEKDFESNQVVYANYSNEGGENLIDTRGYLELAIRTYNQLKSLEDSLIIMRLVRGVQRRVWNIATGKMPKTKAEEYIRGLINRFKKKQIYDPETGKVDSATNIMAMTEDFWFAKSENGDQTSVSTIGGDSSVLGEMTDVLYFQKKMYKALQLPRSRWDENYVPTATYSIGKMGEVTREEIKFNQFIKKLQNRFKNIFIDTFLLKLKLNKIEEEWINKEFYNVQFTESNLFREFKDMELTQARFNMLGSSYMYVKSSMNPEGLFAKEFVLRKYFKMSDEEFEENMKLLEEQDKKDKQKQFEQNGGSFGNQGAFGGGQQFGQDPNQVDHISGSNPLDRFNNFSNNEDKQASMDQQNNPDNQKQETVVMMGKLITETPRYIDYVKNL